ncbi:BED zinc finger and hAT dimerization domain-containing protein DAYSLEEPER [Actinidia rufa]|uniref:BED zinc finger and hAT dimerization domain-containing protein DAYSLEEPER n=1 Tax=Actinidia rufa TaxID=165716 RepID=A0A7J0E321_9ERIC|nr:BED zinc finger and hAT dimerization domain-containing protein DAYSLEEPER [Actinidia rufa]
MARLENDTLPTENNALANVGTQVNMETPPTRRKEKEVNSTSHLKRHIAKGTCPFVFRNQEGNQLTPYSASSKMGGTDTPKRRYRTASSAYSGFDPDSFCHKISRMIIMHDYHLHMIEHPGFVSFVQNLQPRFDMVSFNAVQGDCVATYLKEKQRLQKAIEAIPGRICLSLDLWTSNQTFGYVFLTGYFVDQDWKLHKKLLNVVMEPYPDSDSAFGHAVAACLSDWSVEGSFTLHQEPLMLNGQLLVGNCLACTLSSIAEEALMAAKGTVSKIRDSVKYVTTSESHEEKFLELKQRLQVPSTKSLSLDNLAQWNTTYEMLLAASELKEVFSCLDTSDPDYKEALSMEVWKQVDTLITYLKLLFDTATVLTTPVVQTTNTFFHEAWKIQLELSRAVASEDPFVSSLTKLMQQKFDKYWRNCCLVLAIAVVMDPRFKMKLVEFSFSKIYGDDGVTYVKIIDEGIHELFHEYGALPVPPIPSFMDKENGVKPEDDHGGTFLSNDDLGLTDFDMYIMEATSQQSRSELDQYLEESLLPRVHEFDVLGWWKLNKNKYPTLSKMARDILTIPVCTLGADSVFDTVRKEMDNYRCSLRLETLEALVCTKDWLKCEPLETSKALVKMDFPI